MRSARRRVLVSVLLMVAVISEPTLTLFPALGDWLTSRAPASRQMPPLVVSNSVKSSCNT